MRRWPGEGVHPASDRLLVRTTCAILGILSRILYFVVAEGLWSSRGVVRTSRDLVRTRLWSRTPTSTDRETPMKSAFVAIVACLAGTCFADVLSFSPGLTVQHTYGTGGTIASSFVEIQGFRFTVSGSGMVPSSYCGGLWIGGAFGVARDVHIQRPDGRNVRINAFRIQEHPTGYFGYETFVLAGYDDQAYNVATSGFPTDGNSATSHTFDVSSVNPAFTDLDFAWIVEDTFYVLYSIDLDRVNVCVTDVDDGNGTGTPDGGTTIDDLLYYLAIFEGGDTRADVDDGSGTGTRDAGVTIDDLLYFLARFEAGC